MKVSWLLFLGVILGLSACNWGVPHNRKPAITMDTLAYTYHVIKQRASDCGNKADNDNCTIANIDYPIFKTDSLLNDTIANKLLSLNLFDKPYEKDLNTLAKNFISDYEDAKKEIPHIKSFNLDLRTEVTRQDSSLVSIEIDGSSFSGNQHPIAQTIFINWNTSAKKNIRLSDILMPGYMNKLNKIADTIFRRGEKLSDTTSLANDYFFEGNKFALNNNFLITPLGIKFYYNQYEIKPYAAGTTNLFIPYSKIKSLLLPHTVVSQYIK